MAGHSRSKNGVLKDAYVPAISLRDAYPTKRDHRDKPGDDRSKFAAYRAIGKEPTMPSTILDSSVFRDIFTTPEMRAVWSDENRVQKYLDIEAALARAQASLRIIPRKAATEIVRHCDAKNIDMKLLKEKTEKIGYPVLPVVQQLVGLCKGGLGEWCHWGATTQDITDTATVLQIRESLDLIERDIVSTADALA